MPLTTSENLDGDRNQKRPLLLPRRAVPASRMIAANIYISEGRNRAVIDRLVEVVGGWRGQGRSNEADANSFDSVSPAAPTSAASTSSSLASPASSSAAASAALVHVFVDEPYNRTGFTIAGLSSSSSSSSSEQEEQKENRGGHVDGAPSPPSASPSPPASPPLPPSVPAAVELLASEALKLVDWRLAGGTHPAIGVVDHVAVHALFPEAEGSEEEAARAARRVARSLGALGVPTYLYGSSAADRRKLAEVRRALGCFGPPPPPPPPSREGKRPSRPASTSSSASSFFARFPDPLPAPDSGPTRAEASKGAAAVGSVPWVMNVNVPLVVEEHEGREGEGEAPSSSSSSSAAAASAAASAVARAVSARRGTPISEGGFALPGVEALALAHKPGVVEIACNLTDGSVRPAEVARAVERAARWAGLGIQRSPSSKGGGGDCGDDSSWYVTGKRPEEVAGEAARALGLEIVKK